MLTISLNQYEQSFLLHDVRSAIHELKDRESDLSYYGFKQLRMLEALEKKLAAQPSKQLPSSRTQP